jgi:hypothetical protein
MKLCPAINVCLESQAEAKEMGLWQRCDRRLAHSILRIIEYRAEMKAISINRLRTLMKQ